MALSLVNLPRREAQGGAAQEPDIQGAPPTPSPPVSSNPESVAITSSPNRGSSIDAHTAGLFFYIMGGWEGEGWLAGKQTAGQGELIVGCGITNRKINKENSWGGVGVGGIKELHQKWKGRVCGIAKSGAKNRTFLVGSGWCALHCSAVNDQQRQAKIEVSRGRSGCWTLSIFRLHRRSMFTTPTRIGTVSVSQGRTINRKSIRTTLHGQSCQLPAQHQA